MQLAIVVADGGTVELGDLVLRRGPDARVGDLVEAIVTAAADGAIEGQLPAIGGDVTVRSDAGRAGGVTTPLADLGLRHGSRLVLLLAGAPDRDAVGGTGDRWRLAPLGGVTGRWPDHLEPGAYVVGRHPSCDIVLHDRSVSRRHAELRLGPDPSVVDLGSRNGTATAEGSAPVAPADPAPLAPDGVLRLGGVEISIERDHAGAAPGPAGLPAPQDPTGGATVRFNRPPRVVDPVPATVVRLPAPPTAPSVPPWPWISAVIPVVFALGILVVPLLVGEPLGGYLWLSVVFMLMSPLLLLATHLESVRATRRSHGRLVAAFSEELAAVAERCEEVLAREEAMSITRFGGPDAMRARVDSLDARLWCEVGPEMPLRLGMVSRRSAVVFEDVPAAGDRDCRAAAEELVARCAGVRVPLVVNAATEGGSGPLALVGPREERDAVARWLVLQSATIRPPSLGDVVVVTGPVEASAWSWLRWLPAGRPGARAWPRRVWSGAADIEALLASDRLAGSLLVIDESAPVEPAVVAQLLAAARAGVWSGGQRRDVPAACGVMVDLEGGRRRATVVVAADGDAARGVEVDVISVGAAHRWARAMAPLLEEVPAAEAATALPPEVDLAALLDVVEPDGTLRRARLVGHVRERWRSRVGGLDAVVGLGLDGPLELNLRRDGPHALVAGTTGSGKSEFLQALVVGLAAAHPPSAVTFLLVDYKGGAAFGPCARLPHTVGLVTDLDGGLAARVLASLGAELRRREAVLAAAGAPDLEAMEAMERRAATAAGSSGSPSPPPALVIVVDEFAALLAEVPSFVDGVVDIARRGRSLGLHLVLATQRPAGVVSDHLRANAGLRVALRVADDADSSDVIVTTAAARLPRDVPGRALVSRGGGDVRPFQTAWVGRRRPDADASEGRRELWSARRRRRGPAPAPVELRPFDSTDAPSPAAVPTTAGASDLDRWVDAIGAAAAVAGEPPPRRPWLPPLPDRLSLADAMALPVSGGPGEIVVGLADHPAEQRQSPARVDLRRGVLQVVGRGADVEAVMPALVAATVRGRPPGEMRVDVLAPTAVCALSALGELPQVGSIVRHDDHERVRRLLDRLDRVADAAPSGSSAGGVSLLVLLDVGAFVSTSDRLDGGRSTERLVRLAARVGAGPSGTGSAGGGVAVVVTADRPEALPPGLAAVVADRIAVDASAPPGRALHRDVELQMPVASAAELAALVAAERARWPQRARPIPVLPERVDVGAVMAVMAGRGGGRTDRGGPLVALVGLDDDDLSPVTVDLGDGPLLVAGPSRSGRTTALLTLAGSLPEPVRRVAVVGRGGGASLRLDSGRWHEVVEADGVRALLDGPVAVLCADGVPTVVFVDDATDVDDEVDAALEELATCDPGLHLVLAVESGVARTTYGGVVHRVRRERRALLLQPDVDVDGDLAGVRLPRRGPVITPAGRGELVERGRVRRVQVALPSLGSGTPGGVPHIARDRSFVR